LKRGSEAGGVKIQRMSWVFRRERSQIWPREKRIESWLRVEKEREKGNKNWEKRV
jgi:hypothetical protein